MLPGVDVTSLPHFHQGQLLAICVPGNPAPIAVGTALMSSSTAAAQATGQGKGKLVELLQHYGDALWQILGSAAVPNAGFLQDVVLPVDLAAVTEQQQQAYLDADDYNQKTAAGNGVEGLSLLEQHTSSGHGSQSTAAAVSGGAAADNGAAAASSISDSSLPKDMDQLLERALLQALHKSVKDADLPLNSSTLWSQHITHCR